MRLTWNKVIIFLAFGAIVFLTTSLLKGNLLLGHDSFAHLTYSKLFYQELSEGQFPVRWTDGIKPEFGQPLFNYYQVGFYYLFSAVHFLIPDFLLSIKATLLLLWWTGILFIFLLTKKFGPLPALIASLVYTFSPYLILDLFIRAAFPEFMAISLMPAVFWATQQLLSKPKISYLLLLAIFTAITLTSHLPAFIIFTPILGGFILLQFLHHKVPLLNLLFVLGGMVLGVGLASFYLLPATLELHLINIKKLTLNSFDFHKHFVKPQKLLFYLWGYGSFFLNLKQEFIFFFGVGQWITITSSFIALSAPQKMRRIIPYLLLVAFAVLYVLFFMQKGSEWVWERVTFLQYIQFPWRFFMVIPLVTSLGAASLLSLLPKPRICLLIFSLLFTLNFITYPQILKSFKPLPADHFNLAFREWSNHPLTQKQAYFEPGYSSFGITNQQETVTSLQSLSNNLSLISLIILFSLPLTKLVLRKKIFDF